MNDEFWEYCLTHSDCDGCTLYRLDCPLYQYVDAIAYTRNIGE